MLRLTIDKIHEESKYQDKNKNIKSIITPILQGTMCSKIRCTRCKKVNQFEILFKKSS